MKFVSAAAASAAMSLTAILLAPMSASGAEPAKATESTCSDIHYNAEFMAAYPRAAAACQEVVAVDGKLRARFSAQVVRVEKDYVQLTFLNTTGDVIEPVKTLTLLPKEGQTLRMNGKDVPYTKLAKGDRVEFWIPEQMLGFISDPQATAVSTIVLP